MSLLQHQDFVLYRIRNRYLQCMKDGVGERLISINPSALNVPAFKNAGWGSPSEIRRTYSPPIPVGAETEYFTNNPPRSIRDSPIPPPVTGIALGNPDAEDGLVTGGLTSHFSNESVELAIAKAPKTESAKGSQKAREMHREEDDSSDMSEDSDDNDGSQAPTQRIQFDFSKKEIAPRPRSGSSPIRSGPQVLVTSPSKSRTRRLRGGSHGDVDFNKSLHERLPHVNLDQLPDADEDLLSSGLVSEAEKLHARITDRLRSSPNSSLPRDDGFGDDTGDDSDASTSLSSDFTETVDSNPAAIGNSLSSSIRRPLPISSPAVLHALPPPIRPVSQIQPISALTQLLQAKAREAANPMEPYRLFSGKGELTPVTLKLYIPYSPRSSPFEIIINRLPKPPSGDRGNKETTVAEAIGFALYKYIEDKKEPTLRVELCDINQWTLRMVDDGEPDEDFPPLERTQPVTAYIVKKSGRGGRLGARETKLEGEFALVEATPEQYIENARVTPGLGPPKKKKVADPAPPGTAVSSDVAITANITANTTTTTTTSASASASAFAGPSLQMQLQPLFIPGAPKTGSSKIIRIHISTIDEFAQSVSVCVTSDTYIGEVLEQVCRKKHLDKSKYILRLTGHPNVVWPLERAVSALGDRAELDLVKRKVLPEEKEKEKEIASPGAGESGSAGVGVGSASLGGAMAAVMGAGASGKTPKRGKFLQPVAWTPDMLSSRDYLKFTVWRKASMTFMSRHERILAIDGEYVHIMPSDQEQKTLFEAASSSKTTSIHISTIIGCKTYRRQPSLFKIVVLRPQREMKRYDFEAVSAEQAVELVGALRKGMSRFEGGGGE